MKESWFPRPPYFIAPGVCFHLHIYNHVRISPTLYTMGSMQSSTDIGRSSRHRVIDCLKSMIRWWHLVGQRPCCFSEAECFWPQKQFWLYFSSFHFKGSKCESLKSTATHLLPLAEWIELSFSPKGTFRIMTTNPTNPFIELERERFPISSGARQSQFRTVLQWRCWFHEFSVLSYEDKQPPLLTQLKT